MSKKNPKSTGSVNGVSKKPSNARKPAEKASTGKQVQAWQDDPISGLPMLTVAPPKLATKPLSLKIKGKAVPAKIYTAGTAEFRYWNAAVALRRGADFWSPLLGVKKWQPGKVLPVGMDEGTDLNAYYDRTELAFFHDTPAGQTVYSGESPDVLCHELGHACLDAFRPELWDAPFVETGSFHESFGDMSALLAQLQLPSIRQIALAPLAAGKASELSRMAEQLGAALRSVAPDAVDKDCLRNAYNKFTYIDPQTLPDSAPATQLCAEVHSFSRLFTGAFYDLLGDMLLIRSKTPKDSDLVAVSQDLGRLLVAAVKSAPVQPDYYAQVAAHMIDADTQSGGVYRAALAKVFVRRKILSAGLVKPLLSPPAAGPRLAAMTRAMASVSPGPSVVNTYRVPLPGQEFGIGQTLIVTAPVERQPFLMMSAAVGHERQEPDRVTAAAHRYVKVLFAHDRVEREPRKPKASLAAPAKVHEHIKRTHVLVEDKDGVRLVRRHFNCGCTIK